MQNENFDERQSINLINEMISTAKQEQTGAGYYLTLWGILVFIYSVCLYAGISQNIPALANAWLLFPLGGVLSLIRSKKDDKKETAKSWYDRLYAFVWGGVGICLGVLGIFVMDKGIYIYMPTVLVIYGLASFITGGTTRYYPSLIGAVVCFVCAIFAFHIQDATQFLVHAFAVLCVHIIPGAMMKSYYRKKNYA